MMHSHEHPVSIIVAVDEAGGYSKDGTIPWNVPEDFKHFQDTTIGGVCIMGRHTFTDMHKIAASRDRVITSSILPGRDCYVVSSDSKLQHDGAKSAVSIADALNQVPSSDARVFVLGGYRLWVEALSRSNTNVIMTVIKGETYNCTKHFPLHVLNKSYTIVGGHETEQCYYVTYAPKP